MTRNLKLGLAKIFFFLLLSQKFPLKAIEVSGQNFEILKATFIID